MIEITYPDLIHTIILHLLCTFSMKATQHADLQFDQIVESFDLIGKLDRITFGIVDRCIRIVVVVVVVVDENVSNIV